jgi:LmbE family N-acetylglucosaminyl deacetylase
MDVRGLGTILGVWAHPDDEAYLSAGVMAMAMRAGSRVVCVTATRGELGSPDVRRWPLATLADVRTVEMTASLGVLGVRVTTGSTTRTGRAPTSPRPTPSRGWRRSWRTWRRTRC